MAWKNAPFFSALEGGGLSAFGASLLLELANITNLPFYMTPFPSIQHRILQTIKEANEDGWISFNLLTHVHDEMVDSHASKFGRYREVGDQLKKILKYLI